MISALGIEGVNRTLASHLIALSVAPSIGSHCRPINNKLSLQLHPVPTPLEIVVVKSEYSLICFFFSFVVGLHKEDNSFGNIKPIYGPWPSKSCSLSTAQPLGISLEVHCIRKKRVHSKRSWNKKVKVYIIRNSHSTEQKKTRIGRDKLKGVGGATSRAKMVGCQAPFYSLNLLARGNDIKAWERVKLKLDRFCPTYH